MNAASLQVTAVPEPGKTPTVVRIRAAGDIDVFSAPLLDKALNAATAGGYREIHLDLSEVTFFDCAALRALEDADDAAPGKLRLATLSEPVRLMLRILDKQRRFDSV